MWHKKRLRRRAQDVAAAVRELGGADDTRGPSSKAWADAYVTRPLFVSVPQGRLHKCTRCVLEELPGG